MEALEVEAKGSPSNCKQEVEVVEVVEVVELQ
jgi:hypothetical protein